MDLKAVLPADLWYAVGLIATDGCISGDGRHVDITSAERPHLEMVRRILGVENAIGRKYNGSQTSKTYYRIQFGSRSLVQFLAAVGVTPRKSLTIGPLDVPDETFPDFLRGVIDGDGSIRTWVHPQNGVRQWCLELSTASSRFAVWLQSRIEARLHVKGALHETVSARIHPIYELKYGKLAMKIILRACYYPGSAALERKRDMALECLRTVNKHRWYRDVILRPE